MKIWGISDTHLAQNSPGTMEVHGQIWDQHRGKILKNWQATVNENDIVLVGGDITWAYTIKQAMPDIRTLSQLPGQAMVMVRGNHDVWWKGYEELCQAVPKNVKPVSGNAVKINGQVICGTGGWISPNDSDFDLLDMDTYKRELAQLENSLVAASEMDPIDGIHVLMHFPPFTSGGHKTPFIDLISKFPVTTCTFGHFHIQKEWDSVPQGKINGTSYRLSSTDFLNHTPALIWENDA